MKIRFAIIAACAAALMLAPVHHARADVRNGAKLGGGLPILGGSAGQGLAQPANGSGRTNAPVVTRRSTKLPRSR
jgi:hypothetical protein